MRPLVAVTGLAIALVASVTVRASTLLAQSSGGESRFSVEIEGGPVWQARNDVQIPNDDSGTRFALDGLTGSGPFVAFRFYGEARLGSRNVLRLLVAPLSFEGTGTLAMPTEFDGVTFAPGTPTTATYRFDSYRLTWAYRLIMDPSWSLDLGLTAKIRSAEIGLEQAGASAAYDNIGFVPLVHVSAGWRPAPGWALILDADGAAVSQGRAFDVSLLVRRDVSEHWTLGGGYRTLEGGADVEDVYTFGWLNYLVLSVEYRF